MHNHGTRPRATLDGVAGHMWLAGHGLATPEIRIRIRKQYELSGCTVLNNCPAILCVISAPAGI